MRRFLACLILLCLLLSACDTPQAPPTLTGTWINAGQYTEGRDFVETMTLREDGSVLVHLEYQGADYASLEGRWTAEGDTLTVDFTDPAVKDRSYRFTLEGDSLTLSGDGKDVSYTRKPEN